MRVGRARLKGAGYEDKLNLCLNPEKKSQEGIGWWVGGGGVVEGPYVYNIYY